MGMGSSVGMRSKEHGEDLVRTGKNNNTAFPNSHPEQANKPLHAIEKKTGRYWITVTSFRQ